MAIPTFKPIKNVQDLFGSIFKLGPQKGDIIFSAVQIEGEWFPEMLEAAMDSPIVHSGIINYDKQKKAWSVIEAFKDGVVETPYSDFIKRTGGYYQIKRIKGLYGSKVNDFINAAKSHLGEPYDLYF